MSLQRSGWCQHEFSDLGHHKTIQFLLVNHLDHQRMKQMRLSLRDLDIESCKQSKLTP